MDKALALQKFIAQFEAEIREQSESAKAAHSAATHEESRAEDRHDTFAIEASYLAAGQAARIHDLHAVLAEFRAYLDLSSKKFSAVQEGALLQLKYQGKLQHAFFAQAGGGTLLATESGEISVVTRKSPLGDALWDAGAGDEVEVESKNGIRVYQVVSIC